MEFVAGTILLVACYKLSRYRQAITPTWNRPGAFRNTTAFALLNLAVICTFIGGIWLVITGLSGS